MIEHNAVLKYTIDLPIYLRFYLRVEKFDHALEFEYKHLLMGMIQKCEPNNEIKRSSS